MDKKNQILIVNSWLKEISLALHVDLKLEAQGICTFKLEDHIIAIEVSLKFPVVNIYSSLIPLPVDDRDLRYDLQARALELNAFQLFTRGGAIGTPPGGGFLIYCISLPIENLNSERFSEALGAFYETLPELKKMLDPAEKSAF